MQLVVRERLDDHDRAVGTEGLERVGKGARGIAHVVQTVEVSDEAMNGLIVEQSPVGGDWIELGTAVTVNVGIYVPPPEEGE